MAENTESVSGDSVAAIRVGLTDLPSCPRGCRVSLFRSAQAQTAHLVEFAQDGRDVLEATRGSVHGGSPAQVHWAPSTVPGETELCAQAFQGGLSRRAGGMESVHQAVQVGTLVPAARG